MTAADAPVPGRPACRRRARCATSTSPGPCRRPTSTLPSSSARWALRPTRRRYWQPRWWCARPGHGSVVVNLTAARDTTVVDDEWAVEPTKVDLSWPDTTWSARCAASLLAGGPGTGMTTSSSTTGLPPADRSRLGELCAVTLHRLPFEVDVLDGLVDDDGPAARGPTDHHPPRAGGRPDQLASVKAGGTCCTTGGSCCPGGGPSAAGSRPAVRPARRAARAGGTNPIAASLAQRTAGGSRAAK